MTSDCVTVSNNSCPVVGNNEYIVMFNFAGRRICGFEVIEAGLRSPPSPGQEGKKKRKRKKGPVSIALRPRLKTQTDSISAKVFV